MALAWLAPKYGVIARESKRRSYSRARVRYTYSRDSSPRKLPAVRKWTSAVRREFSHTASRCAFAQCLYAAAPVNGINPVGRKIKSVNVSFTKHLLLRIIRDVRKHLSFCYIWYMSRKQRATMRVRWRLGTRRLIFHVPNFGNEKNFYAVRRAFSFIVGTSRVLNYHSSIILGNFPGVQYALREISVSLLFSLLQARSLVFIACLISPEPFP